MFFENVDNQKILTSFACFFHGKIFWLRKTISIHLVFNVYQKKKIKHVFLF